MTADRRWAGRWAGPAFLGVADQGLSSLSNVLAVVIVARALDADAFGRFALVYAVMILVLGVSRSYLGTRLALAADPGLARAATAEVLGGLLAVAPVVAAVVFGVGAALTGGDATAIALVVAVAAPVVCLQDAVRFGAVASGRPGVAFASDLVWTVCVAAVLVGGSGLSGSAVMAAWLAAAVAALVVGLILMRVRPRVRCGLLALVSRHRMSESMAFGTVVGQAAALAVSSVAAAAIGPAAAGALRGASTILGPLNVVFAYVHLGLTPWLVRRPRSADLRACRSVALVIGGVVVAWGVVVLLVPDAWGTALLGESWNGARDVLPFTVLEYVAIGLATASTLGLKVRGEAGVLARQKAVVGVVMVVLGCGAALLWDDVRAVSAGLAVAAAISAGLGWYHLGRSSRRADLSSPVPAASR